MHNLEKALDIANAAMQSRDRQRARAVYEQILQVVPEEPRANAALGSIAFDEGRLADAESYLRRAEAAAPNDVAIPCQLFFVLRTQGRFSEAVTCCHRAVSLAPNSPELHVNLGVAQKQNGEIEAAAASFSRAVELRPDYADAHYNLANTLVIIELFADADQAYRRAIELAPGEYQAHNNLGTLLELQGRYDEAMACYDAALRVNPMAQEVPRNQAFIHLRNGNFAAAWKDLDRRWRFSMPPYGPPPPEPRWNGEPLAGQTILLRAELGIGDIVQAARFIVKVKQLGAQVLFDCPPKLHALLGTVVGIDRMLPDAGPAEPIHCGISLLSLPAVLGITLQTIPADIPYLFADAARVARWREQLANERGFKVGIAWQGAKRQGDRYRSIPLEHFLPLADGPGVRLFSLQKGEGEEQLPPLADRLKAIDLGPKLDVGDQAFVDTAAVMKNLDLVITSDTSIAHVAGALSVPVWVALQFAAEHRWLLDRPDSPWYPTMRLFRQPSFGDWPSVFAEMAEELTSLANSQKSQ